MADTLTSICLTSGFFKLVLNSGVKTWMRSTNKPLALWRTNIQTELRKYLNGQKTLKSIPSPFVNTWTIYLTHFISNFNPFMFYFHFLSFVFPNYNFRVPYVTIFPFFMTLLMGMWFFLFLYTNYMLLRLGLQDADIKKTHKAIKYYGHQGAWAGWWAWALFSFSFIEIWHITYVIGKFKAYNTVNWFVTCIYWKMIIIRWGNTSTSLYNDHFFVAVTGLFFFFF